jgi:hypothetical protein
MAINGQNAAAIKALVTGATTTEADFRTGTDHIIDHADALDGASPAKTETFLSAGNYTVPSGVNYVLITGSGGGGGGWAVADGAGRGTGGGAGGWAVRNRLAVTGGTTYAVTIGAGGAAGSPGNAGVATTFGNIMTLGGGSIPNGTSTNTYASGGTNSGLAAGGLAYSGGSGHSANNGSSASSNESWIGKFGAGSQNYNNTAGNAGTGGFLLIEIGE